MKKVFYFAVVISILFFCISCDGFLEGQDLKDNIENSITVANAPVVKINFSTEHGSINYLGVGEYKKDISYDLIFNPYTEYDFIEWKVYNKKNKEISDFSKYIQIDNVKESTTEFTVRSTEYGDLEIKPFCVERPIVLNATPLYAATGSYRDEPIVVWFDSQMTESSIYFNKDEIPEDKEPVYSLREGYENKIYAYGDRDEESGKIINKEFKNIKILNLVSQESIADCYREPYFENPVKLVISPDKDNLPPMSTQIVVSVTKNMTSLKNGKEVSLINSKKWNYLTNVNTDQDKPGIIDTASDRIKVEIKNYSGAVTEVSPQTDYKSLSESALKAIYLKDDKIRLYMHFQDLLSGPSEAVIHYARIYNENYEITNDSEKFKTLTCQTSGIDGYYTGSLSNKTTAEIDFETNADGSKIPDGIYKVWFGAKDRNGNEKLSYEGNDKYYYVLKDKTAPSATNISYNYKNKTLSWSATEPLYNVEVKYTNKSVANASATVQNLSITTKDSNYQIDFGSNSANCYFDIEASIEDIFGNKKSVYTKQTIVDLKAPVLSKQFTDGDYGLIRGPSSSELNGLKVSFKSYSRQFEIGDYSINLPSATNGKVSADYYKLYYIDQNDNSKEKYWDQINGTTFKIPYSVLRKGYNNTLKLQACKNVGGEVIEGATLEFNFFEIDCEMVQVYAMYNGSKIWTGAEIVTNSTYSLSGRDVHWYSFGDRSASHDPIFYSPKDNGKISYKDPVTSYGKNIYFFWDGAGSNNHYVYEFEVNGITFYVGSSKSDNPDVQLYFKQPFSYFDF